MPVKLTCFSCHKELSFADSKIGFREECSHCRNDVHACKNCQFYDPKAYNECRESSAEVVREKERANYCEYFQPRSGLGVSPQDKAAALRAAAEALFKKS
jgi:hypothetical protein